MQKTLSVAIAIALLGASGSVLTTAQQPKSGGVPQPPVEDVLRAVREELQGDRAAIIAKNVTLTSDQAAKFWPVFAKYQQEQNVILDEQLKAVQRYADQFDKLDDATALGLMKAHFDRDARMNALRQKWLASFQEVLPTRTAVRVVQIDRRLSLVQQIGISSRIPLVY